MIFKSLRRFVKNPLNFVFRRREHLGAPNRDRKEDEAPQPSDCPVKIWNKENAEEANHSIEGAVSKRSEVGNS